MYKIIIMILICLLGGGFGAYLDLNDKCKEPVVFYILGYTVAFLSMMVIIGSMNNV